MERVSVQCVTFRMPKQAIMYWGRNLQRCKQSWWFSHTGYVGCCI